MHRRLRQIWLTTALAAALTGFAPLSGGAQETLERQQQGKHRTHDPKPDTKRWRETAKFNKMTPAQKKTADSLMLQKGFNNASEIADHIHSSYARFLHGLEDSTNNFLNHYGIAPHTDAVFFNPETADAHLAFGHSWDSTGNRLLKDIRMEKNPFEWTTAHMKHALLGDSLNRRPVATPCVFGNQFADTAGTALVVAHDPYTISNPFMSYDENMIYANRHEAWHAKDIWNRNYHKATEKGIYGFNDIYTLVKSSPARDFLSTRMKQEMLADLGAAGDMIRAGSDIGVIDRVIRWRESGVPGFSHMTSPGLRALKKKITDMGIDAFRALSQGDAQSVYFMTTVAESLGSYDILHLAEYRVGSSTGGLAAGFMARQRMAAKRQLMPAGAKVIQYIELYEKMMAGLVITPAERNARAAEALRIRNALRDKMSISGDLKNLCDRAYRLKGVVSPLSLQLAHTALQEDMRQDARKPGADLPVLMIRARHLHTTFVNISSLVKDDKFSFAEANARRGVPVKKMLKADL